MRDKGFALYLGGLFLLCLYALFRTPIVAIDNDLWYHLSHGRHLFQTGELPSTSYFSFISPPKVWVDYYWLFQAIVYALHEAAGYWGLLAFRTLLFAGFLLAVGGYLFKGASGTRALCWFSLIFGLYVIHSFHKFLMVRPHALSYLMIPLFLYIIEHKPSRAFLLPVLATLWVNVHGIEYPVMILIVFAYVLESWVKRFRKSDEPAIETDGERRRQVYLTAALGLSMAAVFLTPHGRELIKVPFISTEYASIYLNELSQLELEEFFTYRWSLEGFTSLTAANLLILIALFAAVGSAVRGKLRLSHFLMLAGGLFLLTKAVRFTHECTLLALPVIKAYGPLLPARLKDRRALAAPAIVIALLLATPYLYLSHRLPSRQQSYPLALVNLPHGIAYFLNQVDAQGAVLNNPNVGGYLQWALKPDYKIFMDLEIPFLFADEDMFEAASAFFDGEALRKFIVRYDPPFIAATLAATRFPSLIAPHPEYEPVFFDDQGVLYVDRERYPEIAARWAIERVDPFTLGHQRFSALPPEERHLYVRELSRIAEVDPDVSSVNQALAILRNLEGRHDDALEHARRVVAKDPELARGHALVGDALVADGAFAEAAGAYRRALDRSVDETEKSFIYRSLSLAYSRDGKPRRAYQALKRGVGLFNVEASYRELYDLGFLAAAAGEPEEARKTLNFALLKMPAEQAQWRQRIVESLASLDVNEP